MIEIADPTLLVNEDIVRRNIRNMADKASAKGLALKPHFKTHQSLAIGHWYRDYGVCQITVSSLKMARYFSDHGWDDITIALPCIPQNAARLNSLARQVDLTILISNIEVFPQLKNRLTEEISVFIEVDTGARRTGYKRDQPEKIRNLTEKITQTENLRFKGFYSHPGHAYNCRSKKEIQEVHQSVIEKMSRLKSEFTTDFPSLVNCIGDTPCCSQGQNFDAIDEISPGNFVFYDLMQTQIGSCHTKDIAVALACPVIARYPDRQEIIVHGGAIHLSKESLIINNQPSFGSLVSLNEDLCWSEPITDCCVTSLSQEHGVITCSSSFMEKVSIGDIIGILPVHSCLTADAMKGYICNKTAEPIDHLQARANAENH